MEHGLITLPEPICLEEVKRTSNYKDYLYHWFIRRPNEDYFLVRGKIYELIYNQVIALAYESVKAPENIKPHDIKEPINPMKDG